MFRLFSSMQAQLERAVKKSDQAAAQLRSDIERIKGQKSSLSAKVQHLQADYDTLRRGKNKEITELKKDTRKAESEARRLAVLTEKQKAVMQRKIQEAERAKKRLDELNKRRRPATAAASAAPRNSAGAAPPARTASAGPSSTGAAAAATAAPTQATHTPRSAARAGTATGGPLRPNADAPPLPDTEAMQKWVLEEIEAVSTEHLQRKLLDAKISERKQVAQRQEDVEAQLQALSHVSSDDQARQHCFSFSALHTTPDATS